MYTVWLLLSCMTDLHRGRSFKSFHTSNLIQTCMRLLASTNITYEKHSFIANVLNRSLLVYGRDTLWIKHIYDAECLKLFLSLIASYGVINFLDTSSNKFKEMMKFRMLHNSYNSYLLAYTLKPNINSPCN